MDGENSTRAIGLVLLSIAIMPLLLTDADAKRRRSSAQGSQAAGASRSWCATQLPSGSQRLHEIKHDDFCIIARKSNGWSYQLCSS
jgi:hypothetical protein